MRTENFSKSKLLLDTKTRSKSASIFMKLCDHHLEWLLFLPCKPQNNMRSLSGLDCIRKIYLLFRLSYVYDLITH